MNDQKNGTILFTGETGLFRRPDGLQPYPCLVSGVVSGAVPGCGCAAYCQSYIPVLAGMYRSAE